MAVYEFCDYVPNDGKLPALLERFRDHTIRLFARHGIRSVAFWTTAAEGSPTHLVYLLAHDDEESAVRNWAAFGADPEWVAAYQASMADGPLVASMTKRYLHPTEFSALP